MAAWGFDYKSNFCWGKYTDGTGYWNREKHELLLIGTRGKVPCPAPGTQWSSLLLAPRGEHSAKPEAFLKMIEQYFPTLPKIELNRRGPARPGWDSWGNETEDAAA
jgi:N6-adenosine-specific RNA methylase IME4